MSIKSTYPFWISSLQIRQVLDAFHRGERLPIDVCNIITFYCWFYYVEQSKRIFVVEIRACAADLPTLGLLKQVPFLRDAFLAWFKQLHEQLYRIQARLLCATLLNQCYYHSVNVCLCLSTFFSKLYRLRLLKDSKVKENAFAKLLLSFAFPHIVLFRNSWFLNPLFTMA